MPSLNLSSLNMPAETAMKVGEDDPKTPLEYTAVLSRGLESESPPRPENIMAVRDAILATSLGSGPVTYRSTSYGVELELMAGPLNEEVLPSVTVSPRLQFVECRSAGSGRWDLPSPHVFFVACSL